MGFAINTTSPTAPTIERGPTEDTFTWTYDVECKPVYTRKRGVGITRKVKGRKKHVKL